MFGPYSWEHLIQKTFDEPAEDEDDEEPLTSWELLHGRKGRPEDSRTDDEILRKKLSAKTTRKQRKASSIPSTMDSEARK